MQSGKPQNDYLLPVMKASGLYKVDRQGHVWTCKQMGGPIHIRGPWRRAEIPSGLKGRLQVRHCGKLVYASRLIWFWFNGPIPRNNEIDHDDNDVQNNRPSNLSPKTRLKNQRKAEADGLCCAARIPSVNRKRAMKLWWNSIRVRRMMSQSAKRGWQKRRKVT